MINSSDVSKIKITDVLDHYGFDYAITDRGNANFQCPFHSDKNPSCGMHVETGLWKCFGCGASGNIVSFVSDLDSISKEEAEKKIRRIWIQKLPDIASLELVVNQILHKDKHISPVDPTFPEWIISQYTKDWTYMHSRGFNDETLEHFNVIYDPSTKYQGFPIHDNNGKLIGISGRNTQPGDNRYKPLLRFKKQNIIYNLYRINKDEPVIAVEGEINCMAMYQHGYSNTIAFLGAGISLKQIEVVKNSGIKELIIFFDSDDAGQKGALKIFANLWLTMKIKTVDEHEGDPADMNTLAIKSLVESANYFSLNLTE